MSIFSIVLRLVLGVALILNGSGIAMVHAGGTMGHAQHGEKVLPTTDGHSKSNPQGSMGPACIHIRGTAKAAVAAASASDAAPDMASCCQSADCRSGCTQHCAAALAIASVQDAITPHAGPMRPLRAGHLPPALPHLIRPPIG